MTKLGSGHISEEYSEPVNAEYSSYVAAEQRKARRDKIPPTTTQSPSTIANMAKQAERHPFQDKEWVIRPISDDWLAVKDAKDLNEMVGRRALDHEQVSHIESIRRGGSGNTLGDGFMSSVSPERRDSAINAFTYSKPYDPTTDELTRMATPAELAEIKNYTNPDQGMAKEEKSVGWGIRVAKFLWKICTLGAYKDADTH